MVELLISAGLWIMKFSFLRSSTPSFKLSIQKSAFFFLFHRNRTFLRSRSFSTVWITVLGHFYNPLRLALFYFHIWQKEEVSGNATTVGGRHFSHSSAIFLVFSESFIFLLYRIGSFGNLLFLRWSTPSSFKFFFYKVAKNFFFVHFSLFNPWRLLNFKIRRLIFFVMTRCRDDVSYR